MDQLTSFAGDDDHYSRYAWILKGITEELLDELAQAPSHIQDKMPHFMEGFGQIMAWVGNGDPDELPPDVRDILIMRYTKQQQAIEAAPVG